MLKFFTKKLTVPENNDTKEIEAVQTWRVTWTSRHGEYSYSTRKEVEVFTSEDAARQFKDALDKAFTLIRSTSEKRVFLEKNQ